MQNDRRVRDGGGKVTFVEGGSEFSRCGYNNRDGNMRCLFTIAAVVVALVCVSTGRLFMPSLDRLPNNRCQQGGPSLKNLSFFVCAKVILRINCSRLCPESSSNEAGLWSSFQMAHFVQVKRMIRLLSAHIIMCHISLCTLCLINISFVGLDAFNDPRSFRSDGKELQQMKGLLCLLMWTQ